MLLSGDQAAEAELARFRTEPRSSHACAPAHRASLRIGEHDGKPFLALEFCAGGACATPAGTPPELFDF